MLIPVVLIKGLLCLRYKKPLGKWTLYQTNVLHLINMQVWTALSGSLVHYRLSSKGIRGTASTNSFLLPVTFTFYTISMDAIEIRYKNFHYYRFFRVPEEA